MNNMVTKLSSVAALLGVVGAIGAGFVQYGKVMAKIDELDNHIKTLESLIHPEDYEKTITHLNRYTKGVTNKGRM